MKHLLLVVGVPEPRARGIQNISSFDFGNSILGSHRGMFSCVARGIFEKLYALLKDVHILFSFTCRKVGDWCNVCLNILHLRHHTYNNSLGRGACPRWNDHASQLERLEILFFWHQRHIWHQGPFKHWGPRAGPLNHLAWKFLNAYAYSKRIFLG